MAKECREIISYLLHFFLIYKIFIFEYFIPFLKRIKYLMFFSIETRESKDENLSPFSGSFK
jgi:hypothetical protein